MSFTYPEITAALRLKYNIADKGKTAFRGRFQRFQEADFPIGSKTGRAGKAEYGWSQFIQLGLAFECLDLGISPARSVELIKFQANEWLLRIVRHVSFKEELGFFVVRGGGLESIQNGTVVSGKAIDFNPDFLHYVNADELETAIEQTTASCVINLSKFLIEIYEALATTTDLSKEELSDSFKTWAREYDL